MLHGQRVDGTRLLSKSGDIIEANNTSEPQAELIESDNHRFSFREAFGHSARFAAPFALSRLAPSLQSFSNGIVIGKMSLPAVIAVAPVVFMIQHGVMGPARGALSTVNVIVSDLNGQAKFAKIGPAVNQGRLLAVMIAIPTTVLFFTAPYWLSASGIDAEVAEQGGQYLRDISYGILPTYLSAVDQNFLLSIQRIKSPIILNALFAGGSMLIGYPLAFLNFGFRGLGIGTSISAFVNFLLGQYYLYFNEVDEIRDRDKYSFFSRSFDSGTSFCELTKLSFPTALQAVSEWLPTMLIAVITSRGPNSKNILEAEEPSMQMLVFLNQILLGLGTAATVSVANALGKARKCYERQDSANALVWKHNARTIGYADITMTTLITIPPTLIFIIYPDSLVKLFSNDSKEMALSKTMVRLAAATLPLDGIRNTATGAILGKKKPADNLYTSSTNIVLTAGVAMLLGYLTQDSMGPSSFLSFRMMAIFITALLLLNRWNNGSKVSSLHSSFFSRNVSPRVLTSVVVNATDVQSESSSSTSYILLKSPKGHR